MISKRDLQLGKIALRAGMVTKEQLAKSLAIQKKLEKPVGLGAIFLKKGYITREQLEEIVKLHNESKDKNGAAAADEASTGEKKPKKKKKKKAKKEKSKDAKASSEATGTAASSSEASSTAAATNGSEPAKSEASASESAQASAPPATSSEEKAADKKDEKADKKEEKKTSKTATALKKSGGAATAVESGSSASQSEIDTDLLESAPSDAGPVDEDDPERRVITCQKCSKKYRIKKKQAGKRFSCRKCKAKVKIPKDVFDKPPGSQSGSHKKASSKNASVAVQEFSLGSKDDEDEAPAKGDKAEKAEKGDKKASATATALAKKASGTAPAAAAAGAATKKPGTASAGGYADLVKAAANQKAVAPLGPKTSKRQSVLGYIQAVVFLGAVFGIVGGIWYWKHLESSGRQDLLRDARESEWTNVSAPFNAALEASKKAIADANTALGQDTPPPIEVLRDLTTSGTALEKAMTGLRPSDATQQVLQAPENAEKARALLASSRPEDLLKTVFLTRGRVHLALGGESNILEAVRDFNEIVQRDPKSDEALALLGQAELRRRNYALAIDALRRALALKNDPKTHAYLGLALEAGDLCKDAVKEYEGLVEKEPIALVFKARALIADGDADAALAALDAAKVEGEALGAAQARRGQALEKKGDLDGATKAFDAAAAAGGKSGRGHVAKGEFLLRVGRFEEANNAFDAGLKESGGARAALGVGEAKAMILDGESAKRSYLQAGSLPVVASSARLLGELDVFDDPRAPDPRATAQRRTGDLWLAAGKPGDARSCYYAAAGIDPFDPESHAAIAQLEMSVKNLSLAETHVKLAHALMASARDHDAKSEAPSVRGVPAARALLVEAAYYDAKGDLDKAEKSIDAALMADQLAAGSPAFALKGAVLQRKGDLDRAKSEYVRALDLEVAGKDAASRFYNEAVLALEKSKTDPVTVEKARTALDVALVLSPKHAHALSLRGRVFMIEKKYDDALKHYTAALDANIYYVDAYLARGWFYAREYPDRSGGMNDEAQKDFERAIQIEPTRADAYFGRAWCRRAHNDVQPTIDDLTTVIKLDPENAEAYKIRSDVYRQMKKDKEADADLKKSQELAKRGGSK